MHGFLIRLAHHKVTPVIFYLLLASGIVYSSVATDYKYLSPDAEEYLKEAKRLAAEHFKLSASHPFTLWPVGYPYAIALVHVLTGCSVLLSSKLVNVLFLGGLFLLLQLMHGKRGMIYLLLLAHVSVIFLLKYSWSEGGFVFFEMLLLFITGRVMKQQQFGWRDIFISVGCIVLLVLFRYAGVFVFFWLMVLFFYAWKRKEKKLGQFVCWVGLLSFVPVALYLGYTYQASGLVFGNDRGPDHAGFLQNTYALIKALLWQTGFIWKVNSWASFALTWMGQGLLLFVALRLSGKASPSDTKLTIGYTDFSLLSAAAVYFLFVVMLRYFIHFDAMDYRLLMPALLPFAIWVLNRWQQHRENSYIKLLYALGLFTAFSFALNFLPALI